MKKSIFSIVIVSSAVLFSTPALSFGLGDIATPSAVSGLLGGGSATASVSSLSKQQGSMMTKAVSSYENLTKAQALFAEALGLEEELDFLNTETAQIGSGKFSEEESLEKYIAVSNKTQEVIDAKVAEGAELSEESKTTFGKGLVPFAVGTGELVGVTKGIPDWLSGAAGSGVAGLSTLASGLDSFPKIMSATEALMSNMGTIISYAGNQGIDTSDVKAQAANLSL